MSQEGVKTIDVVVTGVQDIPELRNMGPYNQYLVYAHIDRAGAEGSTSRDYSDGGDTADKAGSFNIHCLIALLIVVGLIGLSIMDGTFEEDSVSTNTSVEESTETGKDLESDSGDLGIMTFNEFLSSKDNLNYDDEQSESLILVEGMETEEQNMIFVQSLSYLLAYTALFMGLVLFLPKLPSLGGKSRKSVSKSDRVTQIISAVGISLVLAELMLGQVDCESGHLFLKIIFTVILIVNTEMILADDEKLSLIVKMIRAKMKEKLSGAK